MSNIRSQGSNPKAFQGRHAKKLEKGTGLCCFYHWSFLSYYFLQWEYVLVWWQLCNFACRVTQLFTMGIWFGLMTIVSFCLNFKCLLIQLFTIKIVRDSKFTIHFIWRNFCVILIGFIIINWTANISTWIWCWCVELVDLTQCQKVNELNLLLLRLNFL